MNKKQMRMGSLALSVLLASSLSAPATVMAAETTTSETNQTEVSAAADSAVTEQPVASASTDQATESAPEEQTVSSAPGGIARLRIVLSPLKKPPLPMSSLQSQQQLARMASPRRSRKQAKVLKNLP